MKYQAKEFRYSEMVTDIRGISSMGKNMGPSLYSSKAYSQTKTITKILKLNELYSGLNSSYIGIF